jgi:hypothetical protein
VAKAFERQNAAFAQAALAEAEGTGHNHRDER